MCDDIANQIIKQQEDKIVYEVRQAIGYNIDKQELVKALQYDRGQYQKGYADAMVILDKIRTEIKGLPRYSSNSNRYLAVYVDIYEVLKIIDKYRSYSPCDDCKHEGSFGKEFDDTCIKCKSGSNRAESEG